MHKIKKAICNNRGEGMIDTVVLVLCAMLIIALALKVFPVYMAKQKIDTFATELVREAEIAGRIGSETTAEEERLGANLGIHPTVHWSQNGRIHLNEEITATVTMEVNVGLFGDFGSFPITLRASATGKSERYWKK